MPFTDHFLNVEQVSAFDPSSQFTAATSGDRAIPVDLQTLLSNYAMVMTLLLMLRLSLRSGNLSPLH